ncbi:protein NLP7-like [Rhododendron vialii]|uniref:protein NLP7-like n=1 Tax=Rhododendron vialii TaxID=182163 RepID=UPI00265D8469|nr:protein NLP7-like [Rhododendron vialii]
MNLFFLAQCQFSVADNFVDFSPDVCACPKVRENIRLALQKMILYPRLNVSLVQFWASTKTLEGRTLLTTQNQPFALGNTYTTFERQWLCEYRMMIGREYKFYADAESGEEELGLPGRVFLHKFPESTSDVKHYTLKEYPQLDLALRCFIRGSWAMPVFEHSSKTCVGVLEIVSLSYTPSFWHDKSFLGNLYGIFQEFGMRCFDGYKHCEMRYMDENKALAAAFKELKMVLGSVCKIHKLPLAMTWVPCSACGYLVEGQHLSKGKKIFGDGYDNLFFEFRTILKSCHLRKGEVAGRVLSFPNLLYCSDVQLLSIAEYPLVPYARRYQLTGWFTICLQSSFTGNEVYVLEFFLPTSSKDDENILARLSLILATMEESFKTFKLASGQDLGDMLTVEVIDFLNGQKSHSIQMIQATRLTPCLELLKDGGVRLQIGQLDQPTMDAKNSGMDVVSEDHNYFLPSLEASQNGELTTELDSTDQTSMDPLNKGKNVTSAEQNIILVASSEEGKRIQATRFTPSLELLKDEEEILQIGQLDQPTLDARNSGMDVVSEEQNYILPGPEALQNGEWTTQLDSTDQPSMYPLNNGKNVVTAQQNIILVASSQEGKRKMQEKKHKKSGVRIEVSLEEIHRCSKMRREDAAEELKVSISTLKRVCRDYGIHRWPPRDIKKARPIRPSPVENQEQSPQLNFNLPLNQASDSVAHIKPALQDGDMVTIRAKYENNTIKFRLSLSSRLVELQQEVAKRLNVEPGTYYVKYKDEDNELILIACDEDLLECIHASRSLGNTSIVVLVELKQPMTNSNPAN